MVSVSAYAVTFVLLPEGSKVPSNTEYRIFHSHNYATSSVLIHE